MPNALFLTVDRSKYIPIAANVKRGKKLCSKKSQSQSQFWPLWMLQDPLQKYRITPVGPVISVEKSIKGRVCHLIPPRPRPAVVAKTTTKMTGR